MGVIGTSDILTKKVCEIITLNYRYSLELVRKHILFFLNRL
jgi:hypothetical protein